MDLMSAKVVIAIVEGFVLDNEIYHIFSAAYHDCSIEITVEYKSFDVCDSPCFTFKVELELGMVLSQPFTELPMLYKLLKGVRYETNVCLVLLILSKEVRIQTINQTNSAKLTSGTSRSVITPW